MSVKLLTEHHLELLSLKGCCTALSESTHVKMLHYWKSHVTAHIYNVNYIVLGIISIITKYENTCFFSILIHDITKHPDVMSYDKILHKL